MEGLTSSSIYRPGQLSTSYLDSRKYEHVQLDNGMKCVIISDENTSLSSVCVLNPFGSFYDPPEYQGMSHFLEHMLFLGSRKYPKESYYREFISNNGGKCNAWTYWNFTYYHLDIVHEKYEQAMDILANLLGDPIIDTEVAKREIWAVNSEHYVNSSSNVVRYHTLLRDLANPQHVFSKYLLGNLRTLQVVNNKYSDDQIDELNKLLDFDSDDAKKEDAIDKRKFEEMIKKLKEFYITMFSGDRMYAVLIGKESITELKKIANRTIGMISKRNARPVQITTDIEPMQRYGQLIRFRPLNHWEFISLMFFLPPMVKKLTKPLKFLNHLIGSGANLSLTSFLRDQGLIFDIFPYFEHGVASFSYTEYRITLTNKGQENYEKVLRGFAAYLFWLKTKVAMRDEDLLTVYREWVHEKRIIAYYSSGTEQGLDYCTQVAKNMALFGYDNPELLFSFKAPVFSRCPTDFTDPTNIDIEEGLNELTELLKLMDGEHVQSFFCSSKFEYEGQSPKTRFGKIYKQPIHNVRYTIENKETLLRDIFYFDWQSVWDEQLYMAALNEGQASNSKPNSKPGSKRHIDTGSVSGSQTSINTNRTLNRGKTRGGLAFDIHMTEDDVFGLSKLYMKSDKKTPSSSDVIPAPFEIDRHDFMTDIYESIKSLHVPYICNYSMPDVNYFYKSFDQWLKYDEGVEYCKEYGKMRRFYSSANILGYLCSSNPVNRFEHTIKGYMFIPGASLEQYKNIEFYCENLTKAVKREMKRASVNLLDFQISPTTTGIYFNVYSKLPKLSLEMLSDIFKGMSLLASTSYKNTMSADTVKINYKKMDVVDLAYQQLMASIGLQQDDWETDMASNFYSTNDIAKRTLYAKTVLCFLGRFNVDDCKKKTEFMSNNFCYQKLDFCYPSLPRHGLLQPGKPIILEHQYHGGTKNSAMLWFFQTHIDDFHEYYKIKNTADVNPENHSVYEIAKLYTMIAHHLMQVEYFQSLRSQHCLGYHVYSRVICQDGLLGVAYIVQSANNCPATLALHTDRFIRENVAKLKPSAADIQAAIEAVSKKPLDRTYEKSHLMNRLQEVLYCNEAFDDYIRLPNTTLDGHCISDVELQAFVQRFYISKAGSLQVHVVGGDHRVSQESVVLSFTLNGYRRYAGAAGVRGSLGLSQPASMDLFENWNKKFN